MALIWFYSNYDFSCLPYDMVLNRRDEQPHFPRADRLLCVALRGGWIRWAEALVVAEPQTGLAKLVSARKRISTIRSHEMGGEHRFTITREGLTIT